MKRLIFALAMLPLGAMADTQGMVLRISCGTLIDATNGDMPTTASVNNYLTGLLDGIAISQGVTIPGRLPESYRQILAACRANPTARVHTIIDDAFAD